MSGDPNRRYHLRDLPPLAQDPETLKTVQFLGTEILDFFHLQTAPIAAAHGATSTEFYNHICMTAISTARGFGLHGLCGRLMKDGWDEGQVGNIFARIILFRCPQATRLSDRLKPGHPVDTLTIAEFIALVYRTAIATTFERSPEPEGAQPPPQGPPPKSAPPPSGSAPKSAPPPQGAPPKSAPPPQGAPPKSAPPPQGAPPKSAPPPQGAPPKHASPPGAPPPAAPQGPQVYSPSPSPTPPGASQRYPNVEDVTPILPGAVPYAPPPVAGCRSFLSADPVRMTIEEENRQSNFSTHRVSNAHDYLTPHLHTLTRMPVYSFPKAIKINGKTGFATMINGLLAIIVEFASAMADTKAYVATLPARLTQHRRHLSVQDAALLQVLTVEGAAGPLSIDWVALLAEIGASVTVDQHILTLLRIARLARPPVNDAEWEEWVAGKAPIQPRGTLHGLSITAPHTANGNGRGGDGPKKGKDNKTTEGISH